MNPGACFRNAFSRFGEQPALLEGGQQWTFAELGLAVDRLSGGLLSQLDPGARIGLYMQNRAEYLILQLAIEQVGMVRVPMNARYTAHDVERVAEDCGISAIFFDAAAAAGVSGIADNGVWLCQIDGDGGRESGPCWNAIWSSEPVHSLPDVNAESLASINYTSGSSGTPKGVMLSYRAWNNVYRNMLIDRDIDATHRLAHIGPLTHASGCYATPFLLRGACNVIVPGGALDLLLPTIEREKITAFTCVPTVLTRILNDPDLDNYDLSSLRWIGYGAEPIQSNTLTKAVDRWGDLLTHNYGQTEAMMTCTYLGSRDHVDTSGTLRFGCIGRPYSFVDIVLRDQEGQPVPTGEIGEITICSDHIMSGYWNKPEETDKVLRNGWIWTGDLARQDKDGLIYLVGRSKEMLISGGFNIYPAEVEACLSGCPGVRETAVIGLPDETLGEVCTAFVVRDSNVTVENCQEYCKPLLGIRTPRRWIFIENLPRTGNGKVDKAALKSQTSDKLESLP